MADKIALFGVARVRMLAWIEALESDEYTQARKALALSDGPDGPFRYCCLGVLCEVAIANGLPDLLQSVTRAISCEEGSHVKSYGDHRAASSAPVEVLQWLFPTDEPVMNQNYLIHLNDDLRADFHQIAAYLRETYGLNG